MNSKHYFILFFLLFVSRGICYSQQPFLTITYSYSERSKDSHSINEVIDIKGTNVLYTVKYSGSRGPDQQDEKNDCVLTGEQVNTIWKAINDKQLNGTDSLVDNSLSDNSTIWVSINILVTNGNKISKIKVKGTPSAIKDKPLYKNSLSLFYLVKEMLKNCKQSG